MIIPTRKDHAHEIAELHYNYVKSLLKDLGKRMCRVFYETALSSDKNCYGFVYIVESKVIGFVLGTRDNANMFRGSKIYLELLFALCKKPLLVTRFLSHLTNKFSPAPELAYIAVHPQFRGQGIGEQLLRKQHEEFKRRNIQLYEVKIDRDNLASLALHKKLGAKVQEKFWEGNTVRLRLHIEVSD